MTRSTPDNEKNFNRLYELTRDPVYHYLHHYTKDTHLIEDLMQQCYLKVWQRIDRIERPDDALPLLKTYARNLLIDTIRQRIKEDIQWLDAMEDSSQDIPDTSARSSRQQLEVLDIAIGKLPDNCRMVYLFHREEGLSYKEIAERLAVSVSMVEKHMSKAIRLLKHELLTEYSLLLFALAAGYFKQG